MMRILIADDHAIVRRGIIDILSDEPDMSFGEASQGQDVLNEINQSNWDVLVLDINMPGRGGLDVLREIRQQKRRIPTLILSMHPEEQFAVRALKLGADGYLTKDSAPDELVRAIRKVVKGEKYVSSSLAERLALALQANTSKPPHETLSDREYQILRLLASGRTVSEIGRELSLSVKTISTYRTRILEKMNLRTTAELIHYAVTNGLVG